MLIAALFLRSKEWKQPKFPSINVWINKMEHSHTLEYYLTTKSNEALIRAITWMNLENSTLSRRSQTQKTTYWMFLFMWNGQSRKIQTKSRLIVIIQVNQWQLSGKEALKELQPHSSSISSCQAPGFHCDCRLLVFKVTESFYHEWLLHFVKCFICILTC